ncbi:MAG TPA: YhdP family protein [Arenimonas sp.]|uniref:YhdP family protein n=1 Tax=Arenimonas sp. TaxID=1872635 RepID=UPI002D7E8DA8|nr:YhdP family protein [Arenimonas sp.]HEU0152831.1 YhdP family protein [Arenimonas sp.]
MISPLRRRIRHARRITGYGLLVLLILAATVVGGLNQLLPLVERHPDQVAAWLSERIGQPVSFTAARGEWTRRGPRFTLDGLRIGPDGRRLDIGRAELLVAVYSGLLPGAPLTELKVRELSLVLEQGEDRRWRMVGLPFQPDPAVDPLDTLEALGELQVERARLAVRSPSLRRELQLPRVDLRLRVSGNRLLAGVRARAVDEGTPLQAVVDLERDGWTGTMWAGGESLRLDEWSPLLADTGLVVAGAGDLDLWARIDRQRVMDVRSRAEFAPLALGARTPWHREGGGALGSPPVAFERADLLARWQVDGNGWQLHAPELHFHEAGRRDPHSFDGLWLAGGERFALQAPRMDLAPARALATLSDAVPTGLRQWLHEATPDGVLHDVQVHGRRGDWSGTARIESVGWDPYGDRPGVQGLGGNVAYDQAGGVLRLSGGPARFDWPRFRQPIDFRLGGTLGWWREGDLWTAGASDLRVRGADFGARVRAEVHFPGDGARPRVDLAAVVDPSPVQAAGKFWVQGKMPQTTIDWLDRALEGGSVEQGRAVLSGDLSHWPFRDGEGRFDARARLSQARVNFNPEWPVAEAMDLDVAFDGPGMTLEGQGMILGNRVRRVAGGIASFRDPRLVLDIEAPAAGESLQALMLASPLRARFEDHLLNASIRGPAEVTLALDLPLAARLGGRRIEGRIDLDGARLLDPRWDIDLRNVRGRTRFSDRGFAAEALEVDFEGEPARFSLLVGEDYVGDPGLAARASLVGDFPAQKLLDRHPPLAWLDPYLVGRSTWSVTVDIPQAVPGQPAAPSRLSIDSNLAGTAVGLPAPLAKPAEATWPLRLKAPLPLADGEVSVQLGDTLRLRGRMGSDRAMNGVLQFGPGDAAPVPAQGLVALGRTETLDAAGWIAFAAQGEGTGGLRQVDLQVARLDLLGSRFPDSRLQLVREAERTRLSLDGPAVSGSLTIPRELSQGIDGRFARLHWPEKPEATPEQLADLALGRSDDPSRLPPLRFNVQDLRLGALALGVADLQAQPIPEGLRIERFDTTSEAIELRSRGEWLRDGEGTSRSRFSVEFGADSLGDMLGAFGLAGMVEDGETRGRLEGEWPGSPGAFALARFEGRLAVEVGEGQLLEVEPGGSGRVLGLISLAEIPRRLSLDFSDFFEKGFGFNTMKGEFVFADGRASTDLLQINGPAAEIRVSGDTDLRAQRYDQRIEVLPKAGGALPVIGAIAGGPVGAAVGAVAQAVLQKPLKQAARTVYRITGPWAEPVIEVVEKGPPPTTRDPGAAPSPAPVEPG